MRYFSVEAAETLIPELERLFASALRIRDDAQAKALVVRRLEAAKEPDAAKLALEQGQLQFLVNAVNSTLRRIAELGAMPKGLDPALVDFPYRLEGREVYLCWKLGEKRITHYHGLEEGYPGRKRLPRPTPSA